MKARCRSWAPEGLAEGYGRKEQKMDKEEKEKGKEGEKMAKREKGDSEGGK